MSEPTHDPQQDYIASLEARVRELEQECEAYRTGGITEALLRKGDGFLKVGTGCTVVRSDEWAALTQAHQQAVWPHIIAPSCYENPAEGWEDSRLPDFQLIWRLAREVGYAVGIHGSLKRDVDLIAAPWTDEAVGNKALIDHLCAGLNAAMTSGPERKPCGRYAATLQIDGYYKPIDLSIMPRHADLLAELQQAVEALKEYAEAKHDFDFHRLDQDCDPTAKARFTRLVTAEDTLKTLAFLATHKEKG